MATRVPVLICFCLAGCVQSGAPGSPALMPPDRNCDGTRLTDLASLDFYYGQQSRAAAGLSVDGGCNGPGPNGSFEYGHGPVKANPDRSSSCYLPIPDDDGVWYVTAVAVNSAGRSSSFSNEIEVGADAPRPYRIDCAAMPE